MHPYVGVVDDARFYAAQMVRSISGHRFDADLYFLDGSQDDLSLFTWLVRPIVDHLGMVVGSMLLSAAFQALWLGGAFCLVTALVADWRSRLFAVGAVLLLPGNVVWVDVGGALLTPRLPAEALTLWGVGLALRSMRFASLLAMGSAFALHPLMAAPGFGVLLLLAWREHRLLLGRVAGGAAVVLACMVVAGMWPVAGIGRVFDPAWFAIVSQRSPYCFLLRWPLIDWLPVIDMLACAGIGLVVARPDERRLLVSALLVAIGGIGVSILGGDLLHDVLLLDLQLWRATWLLGVIAHAAIGLALLRLPRSGGSWIGSRLGLSWVAAVALALTRIVPATILVAVPLAALALGVCVFERATGRALPLGWRLCVVLLTGIAIAIGLVAIGMVFTMPGGFPIGWLAALLVPAAALVMIVGAGTGVRGSAVAVAMLLPAVVFALARWDQRSAWSRFVESGRPPPGLTALLPGDAPIYWDGDVTVPWLLLRRASYFSCEQGTGVMFNRATAIDYRRRRADLGRLGGLDFGRTAFCPADKGGGPLTRAALSGICARAPGLGAVVLTHPLVDDQGAVWVSPVVYRDVRLVGGRAATWSTSAFHIYQCDGGNDGGRARG